MTHCVTKAAAMRSLFLGFPLFRLTQWVAGACIGLASASAFSGTITVPLQTQTKRPAGDLFYQGRALDEAEALGLARSGVDLWRLNPQESLLWKDQYTGGGMPVDTSAHLPAEGGTVRFDSYLASTKGIFRSSVDVLDQTDPAHPELHAFTMSISLSNPAALMRAHLLRQIGYQVNAPHAYRKLTVRFASIVERDQFLDNLADRSLTSRDRWIENKPEKEPVVTLRGIVLEPGRIQVQTVHWGLMSAPLQQDRRVFRALVVPDVLLDFTEKLNAFTWECGKIFNGSVVFDYLYSDGFSDVAGDDIKWIISRFGRLTRDQLKASVEQAGLPEDITALLTEKVVSRRNSLVRLVGLEREVGLREVRANLSQGYVVNGQLTSPPKDAYEGYPQEFYDSPEKPPLRFSQLWRYATIETLSAGIGQVLSMANTQLLSIASSGNAVAQHNQEVSQGVAKYLFKTGGLNDFQQTTGVWAKPIAGAHINASRTVVAGTYLGSDSQVQLVDTLGVDFSGGFYLGWDGLAPVAAGVSNTLTLSRTYSHIRPVTDMKTALRTNWGHLIVAPFMRKFAKVLDPDISCSIPEGPWTSEFEVDGTKFTKINYDSKRPNGKEEALELRKKLIAEGTPENRILLQANERDSDCKSEVEKAVDKNLEGFLEELAVGETFIVTDSVKTDANASVSIPVTAILGNQVSVVPNSVASYAIARQTMIKRTVDGIQVYLRDQKFDSAQAGADFRFFINLAGFKKGVRQGKSTTDFYNIVTDEADTETKRKLIRSVKALLKNNNAEILEDSFQPYTIVQDLFTRLMKFSFLLWSREGDRQYHEVDIYPPMAPKGPDGVERNRGDYKRTLALRRSVVRTGMDWFGFVMGAVTKLTGGIVSLPSAGAGGDPGNSPGGKSITHSVTTQAELTPTKPMNPVTTVEQTYRGWRLTKKDLFQIFDRVEAMYGELAESGRSRGLFDRTQFAQTSTVQLYQIDTTLIFYPEALEKAKNWLTRDFDEKGLFKFLTGLEGEKRMKIYCGIAESQFGRNGPQVYRGKTMRGCAPDWVLEAMKLRNVGFPQGDINAPGEKGEEVRKARLDWFTTLFAALTRGPKTPMLMRLFDKGEYFFVTRVNGFRKNDAVGTVDYVSDTVGRYDNQRGMGMYRDFSNSYGISLFELYGRFFTEGL
jgi:hypothetical protein